MVRNESEYRQKRELRRPNHPFPKPNHGVGKGMGSRRSPVIPKRPMVQVPREKGHDNGWDGRRFAVCPGCRWYEEHREERETGLVYVTRRWCRLFRREISEFGDFVGCRRRETDERSRDV